MGDRTGIEWSDATWSPLLGCRRVSPGCFHCYAERQAARMAAAGQRYHGIVKSTPNGPRWTGASRLVVEALDQPLRWRRPRRIFVDSMADLFFEGHSNEDIAAVFGVMAAAPQHTFQVLTKRPARAREWFAWLDSHGYWIDKLAHVVSIAEERGVAIKRGDAPYAIVRGVAPFWPLPNVWIGTSAEDQPRLEERLPELFACPAAVHFLSYEPALGPIDISPWDPGRCDCEACSRTSVRCTASRHPLDWLIAGSESGPGARPAELEWFRQVRDQCAAAGVSFFFKQWVGAAALSDGDGGRPSRKVSLPILDGRQHVEWPR